MVADDLDAVRLGLELAHSQIGALGRGVWLTRAPDFRRSQSIDVPDNVPESHTTARTFQARQAW